MPPKLCNRTPPHYIVFTEDDGIFLGDVKLQFVKVPLPHFRLNIRLQSMKPSEWKQENSNKHNLNEKEKAS